MAVKKILFPTDFSHTSDAALELATSLARDMEAKLLIVHVEEPPQAYSGGGWYYGEIEPTREELAIMLQEVVPSDPHVGYEHRLITDKPADGIVDLAKKEHVEMIVMSTHGRTGVMRLLMGSVAEDVVRRSPCPVLTYKPTVKKPEKAKQ